MVSLPSLSSMKLLLVCLVCFGLQNIACISAPANGRFDHSTASQKSGETCAEVQKLEAGIRSADVDERGRAKSAIVTLAHSSESARRCVVEAFLKVLATGSTSKRDFFTSPERYRLWEASANILGEVKAAEAIEDLVNCLDCNNGRFGLTSGVFPASKALINIGERAVPHLAEPLQRGEPMTKYVAALTLREIGGREAKATLEEGLRKEKDEKIAATIRYMLTNWGASPN